MSSDSVTTTSTSSVRSWRTAFLSLRDETLNSLPPIAVLDLLRDLIVLQHPEKLIGAASQLPPHEVTSDLIFLMELASSASGLRGVNAVFVRIAHLVHDITCKVHLEVNTSSFDITLNFLNNMIDCINGEVHARESFLREPIGMESLVKTVAILRFFLKVHGKKCSSLESTRLVKLLLHIISCLPTDLLILSHSNGRHWNPSEVESLNFNLQILLDIQLFAFTTISDTFTRMGSCVSSDLWQCTVDVLRKVMDAIASKNLLVEGHAMSRFYAALLRCLHLILSDPKGSISEHVAGFLAVLQMFFMYGLPCRSTLQTAISDFKKMTPLSPSLKSGCIDTRKPVTPYRPPHRRKQEGSSLDVTSQISAEKGTFTSGFTSSDSEHSDSDGFLNGEDHFQSSKTRVSAIICIQDLCIADPKSLASLWTMLLPTSDVLQPRKSQATIMTSLLFDHVMKARSAAASALASLLDGHSSIFLQVAEYKDSSKCGSFTTLSSSLGQILMQLHRGLLYLVQYDAHSGLLPSLFKVLTLLVSATPYSRMPEDLLLSVFKTLRKRIYDVILSANDNSMPSAISCVASALSTAPPSIHVLRFLEEELSTGAFNTPGSSSVLRFLFQFSQPSANAIVRFEALQALRAVAHNYPSLVDSIWEEISASVLWSLQMLTSSGDRRDDNLGSGKGDDISVSVPSSEKCEIAAIKVLDESLRASCGFKGIDYLSECRTLDAEFTRDSGRIKRISCAPSSELSGLNIAVGSSTSQSNGTRLWSEVIKRHLCLTLKHYYPTVRAVSVTCFAGLTSSVFISLAEAEQIFILSSIIAAADDEVPSVRSAACRALGVVASFPQIFTSFEILKKFIDAAVFNTHDHLISVRITSSWALANICDSLRYIAMQKSSHISKDHVIDATLIAVLVECALQLTKDGDKVKSNAVRALGNISRFVMFTGYSTSNVGLSESCSAPPWLERMVQAFVSCVTTGNVKVQWNVCHALGNLFLNDTLKLRNMAWASSVYAILLLLVRDSTNYKIRINAAVALSMPVSKLDYVDSFSDVVRGLGLSLDSLSSDKSSLPSNFRYKDTLEKQLTLSMLHVLGFVSSEDEEILTGFLVKKSPFLEEWVRSISSLPTSHDKPLHEANLEVSQQDQSQSYDLKVSIAKAVNSLIEVYNCTDNPRIASRFQKLLDGFV